MSKLYYFNPHTYGETAFVVAETKEQAIQYLKDSKQKYEDTEYMKWWEYHKEHIEKMLDPKEGYTIDEYEQGQVFFSEIS